MSIDTSGLILDDDHYLILLATGGIRAQRAQNVFLADVDLAPNDGVQSFGFHRLLADFTGDDFIDTADYLLFQRHYPSRAGDSRYDPVFDLDGSGEIDLFDYSVWHRRQDLTSDTFGPLVVAALSNDTGRDRFDGITFDAATIGTAGDTSDVAALSASLDGEPMVDMFGAYADRGFTFTPDDLAIIAGGVLSDGPHTLRVQAEDVYGNQSPVFELSFTLDTIAPPAPPTLELPHQSDSGLNNSDGITNVTRPPLRTLGEADSLVRLLRDGTVVGSLRAASDVEFTTSPIGLPDAVYEFTATAEDVAGNVSEASAALTVTVDTLAPRVPEFDLESGFDTPPLADHRTLEDSVSLVGHTDPGVLVELNETGQSVTSDGNGRFEFTGVLLAFGSNPFSVVATDAAGNTSSYTGPIVRIGPETDPPVIAAGLANDTGREPDDGVTLDATVSGTVTDAAQVTVFSASLDGMPAADILVHLAAGSFTLTPADLAGVAGGTLADGPHTLQLVAADEYLNRSDPFELAFTLDTTPPAAPGSPDLAAPSDTGASDQDNVTRDTTPTVHTQWEPGSLVRLFVDGLEVAQAITPSPDGFDLGPLAQGSFEISVEVEDLAGNVTPAPATLWITVDLTPPALPVFDLDPASDTPPLGDRQTEEETVALAGQTDPNAVVTLYRVDASTASVSTAVADGTGAFLFSHVAMAQGANDLRAVAADASGNTSQFDLTITSLVPDTTSPVITAGLNDDTGRSDVDRITSDPTIVGTVTDASRVTGFRASLDGAAMVDVLVTLVDGSYVLVPADLALIAGGPVLDGEHVVRLEAEDDLGNISPAVRLEFTLDTTRPLPPTMPDLATASDTGRSSGDNVTRATTLPIRSFAEEESLLRWFVDGGQIDETTVGGPVDLSYSAAAGDGTYRFTADSEDAAGNQSLFSSPLVVAVDTAAPEEPVFQLGEFSSVTALGPEQTGKSRVEIQGRTDPNVRVELLPATLTTQSDASGAFQFFDVPLALGANPLFTAEPMIADTGDFVLRYGMDSEAPILAASFDFSRVDYIAGQNNGFTSVGRLPGISDDGKVIVFVGEHQTQGTGLFMSTFDSGHFNAPVKIAGISGDGRLDPGEVYEGNPSIDVGFFGSLEMETRIGVNHWGGPNSNQYAVAISATDPDGTQGLHNVMVTVDGPGEVIFNEHRTILNFGEAVPGVGSVSGLSMYDPINNFGQMAFWVDAGGGKIVKATPNLADAELIDFASPPSYPLDELEITYKIEIPQHAGVSQEFEHPLDVGFFASSDGVTKDRFLGKERIHPAQFGPAGLFKELVGEDDADAMKAGVHRLRVDPANCQFHLLTRGHGRSGDHVHHRRDQPGNRRLAVSPGNARLPRQQSPGVRRVLPGPRCRTRRGSRGSRSSRLGRDHARRHGEGYSAFRSGDPGSVGTENVHLPGRSSGGDRRWRRLHRNEQSTLDGLSTGGDGRRRGRHGLWGQPGRLSGRRHGPWAGPRHVQLPGGQRGR